MKRKIIVIFSIIIIVIFLSACSNNSTVIGRWESADNIDSILTFFSDGTGVESINGEEFSFEWYEDGEIISLNFFYSHENSLLYSLMSLVLHGSPVESFGFIISDGGQRLIITDNHGHGHFQLEFIRVD